MKDHEIKLPPAVEPGDPIMLMNVDAHEMLANVRKAYRRLAAMSDEEIELGIRKALLLREIERNRRD